MAKSLIKAPNRQIIWLIIALCFCRGEAGANLIQQGQQPTLEQVRIFFDENDCPEALRHLEAAQRHQPALLDAKDRLTALVQQKAGSCYAETFHQDKAVEHLLQALETFIAVTGDDQLEVAEVQNNLGAVYAQSGELTKASEAFDRALEIRLAKLSDEHPAYAQSLTGKGNLLVALGRFDDADLLLHRSLAIQTKALGSEHADIATTLHGLGYLYDDRGDYQKADEFYNRGLAMREKLLGPEHLQVAESLNYLAYLYYLTGRYKDSEARFLRTITIREKKLGDNHPLVANVLNNLALLYDSIARYEEAEPLYKRAISIRETFFDVDHPDVAPTLNNLAMLYRHTGRYEEAEPLYQRALSIMEETYGPEARQVATLASNLATLYRHAGRLVDAEPLVKRALDIREKLLGGEHLGVAWSLEGLAALWQDMERHEESISPLKRALAIREKKVGKNHPDVAVSLALLGHASLQLDMPQEAEQYFQRALQVRRQAYGEQHPQVAGSYCDLAFFNAGQGANEAATQYFDTCLSIAAAQRDSIFQLLSERQKLNYVQTQETNVYGLISHALAATEASKAAPEKAFQAWLDWKGSVLEAQTRYLDVMRTADATIVQDKWQQLREVRNQLARYWQGGLRGKDLAEYRRQTEESRLQKEALEAALSRMSQEYSMRRKVETADLETISRHIPADALYVDFALVDRYDFAAKEVAESRYVVFVLEPGGENSVALIDIGEATPIDESVRQLRDKIHTEGSRRTVGRLRRTLSRLLIEPIASILKTRKKIIISPDGMLHLLPFEILYAAGEKTILESYQPIYVGSGRDLVRWREEPDSRDSAVVFADPDFGQENASAIKNPDSIAPETTSSDTFRAFEGLRFEPLPGTRAEGQTIADILANEMKNDVQLFFGKEASEAHLLAIRSPTILHLATHGFFLETAASGLPTVNKRHGDRLWENPLHRSGIALAGANRALGKGRGEGIVSAEEILGIDLLGTDLVVLSACETAVGEIRRSEGVFGLKRAIILAGANTLVMSLWQVSDEVTRQLMSSFYQLMASGLGKAESLRRARLQIRKSYPDPYFWGSFILNGNPN